MNERTFARIGRWTFGLLGLTAAVGALFFGASHQWWIAGGCLLMWAAYGEDDGKKKEEGL